MCGIAGHYAYASGAPAVDREALLRTRDSMAARGPDGEGIWLSADGKLGLAHRRLAIIDLSELGAQPMHSPDGRFTVTFNGEIYNYAVLRADLERQGAVFRSNSDTEVLLHLYRHDGPAMLDRLRGMFAFALWDDFERTLFLARDPHGIKPLYYADDGRTLRFASQVHALKAGGDLDLSPDTGGAAGLLLWGSVPEPLTLYRSISLLPAGHNMMVRLGRVEPPRRYWSMADALRAGRERARDIPAGGEVEYLRACLLDSVSAHMVADVPVGAFLSAGLDSSTVVGLARKATGAQLQTLTLSFDELQGGDYDECPQAAQIARHLDVTHRCLMLPSDGQETELDEFLTAMDQPTVDGINSWFISLAARRAGLKVALSGLGGDELLGGYASFKHVPELVRRAARVRNPIVSRLYRLGHGVVANHLGLPRNEAGLYELAGSACGAYQLARGIFMPWEMQQVLTREALREGMERLAGQDMALREDTSDMSLFEQIAYLEGVRYMRNQLLRDTDWVSMAHSLEIRVPLVDAVLTGEVIGLASSGRLSKISLAATLRHPLPEHLARRPKTGFTTPTWKWLRHHPGLDAWKQVPLLAGKGVQDPRRWAYTLLHRVPEARPLLRHRP